MYIREYYRALQSVSECFRIQSVTKCYSVLESVTECCRVLQSITECFRVLQSISSASTWPNVWACFQLSWYDIDWLVCVCLLKTFPLRGQTSHHLITFIKNYFSIGQNFRISYQTNSLRTFCGISTAPHKIGLFLLPYPGQFISLNLQLLFCM